MREEWTDILVASFRDAMQRLATVAPRILAMLTLVAIGWVLAALARRVTSRVLRAADFDERCGRWGFTAILGRAGVQRPPSGLGGQLVFWTLFLAGLLMGIEVLEIPAAAGLAAVVLRFLPNLIVAGLVLAVGWILAHFLAQAALIGAVNAQVAGAPLVAGVIRWLVLIFAGAVALTQLGIAREMVLLAFGIAFGGAVLALALAFGLGARDLARQVLEGWLRRDQDREADRISHV
jgi:mechanosensitive ion channel-like protein